MTSREIDEAMRQHHGLIILFLCKKRHISKTDSRFDDYEQEMRIALWHAIVNFNPDRGVPFGSYAILCMARRFSHMVRAHLKRPEEQCIINSLSIVNAHGDNLLDLVPDPTYSFETVIDDRITADAIMDAAFDDKKTWSYILRRRSEGWTFDDIGKALGIKRQAVFIQYKRAIKKLESYEALVC